MSYEHTQRAPLPWVLYAVAALLLWAAWTTRERAGVAIALTVGAGLLLLLAPMFRQLTVRDDGDALAIRFGPIPVFGTRIRYDDVTAAAAGRSSLIDGWGIHYVPGRGWTYNLWGFDCVELTVRGRTVRVGSDDAPELAAFLRRQIEQHGGQPVNPRPPHADR